MDKWTETKSKEPDNEKALYWVIGGEAGVKPILARWNNYRGIGGRTNYWQTMNHDDFNMSQTMWIEVIKPKVPEIKF